MLQIARSLWFKVSAVAAVLALLLATFGGRLILAQARTGADALNNVHESATAAPNDPHRVADVRVAGNARVATEKVLRFLRTRAGNKYDRSLLTEDTRRLLENHLFKDVRAETVQTGKGLLVTFRVVEFTGAIEEVVYRNVRNVSKETLEEMMPYVRKGEPLDPALNKRAAREIQDHLKNGLGHYWASVTLEEGALPTDQRVVFNLSEGPVLRVGTVRFLGDEFADAARLSSLIATRPSFFGMGGIFNEPVVDCDVKKLEDFYHDHGYLYAKVARELIFAEDGNRVDVVFHVSEGWRHRVEGVTLDCGPARNQVKVPDLGTFARLQKNFRPDRRRGLPIEEMRKVLRTQTGEYYSKKMVNLDVSNLKKFLRDHDLAARVEVDNIETGPGLLSVQYEVVPDEKARFDPVAEETPVYSQPRLCWTASDGYVEVLSSKLNFLIPVAVVFARACEWGALLEAMLTETQTAWSERIRSTDEAMTILKESDDGARRGEACAALKEPLQNGGTQEEQDLFMKVLVQAANPSIYSTDADSVEPLVRLGAIRALGGYKDRRAVPALVEAYFAPLPFHQDMNAKIRLQIIRALEKTGSPVARDFLLARAATSLNSRRYVDVDDNDQRLAAVRSLARFDGEDVGETLVGILEERGSNFVLRNRANLTLQALTGADLTLAEPECWRFVPAVLLSQSLDKSPETTKFVRRLQSLEEQKSSVTVTFVNGQFKVIMADATAKGWDSSVSSSQSGYPWWSGSVIDTNAKEPHVPSPADIEYALPLPFPVAGQPSKEQRPIGPPTTPPGEFEYNLPLPFPATGKPAKEQQPIWSPTMSDADVKNLILLAREGCSLTEPDRKLLQDYVGYRGLKPKVNLDTIEDGPGLIGMDYTIEQPAGVSKVGQIFVVGTDVRSDRVLSRPSQLYDQSADDQPTPNADAEVITEIVIKGNKHVSTEKIMRYLLTCRGMPLDKTLLRQDLQRLVGSQLFSAVDSKCTEVEGGVRVTVEVEEHPVVEEIRFEHGGRLSGDDVRELTRCSGLVKFMTPDPEANNRACAAIQAELVSRGYRSAKVWLKQGGADDAQVIFGVDEGPLVHIRSINFAGNSAVSCEKLRSRVDDKMLLLECTGAYQAPQADELCRDLEHLYQARGYCEASVRHEVKFAATYDEVVLTFNVKEGRHYRVKDWRIEDQGGEVPTELKNVIKLRKGDFYDASLARKDAEAISDSYRKLGKTIRVNVDLSNPDTGFVRVIYHVAEPSAQGKANVVVQSNTGVAATVTSFLRPRSSTTEENVVQEVVYRNAEHVSQESLQNLTKIHKGMPLDPVANLLACREIQEHLKNKGRYWAKVTLDEGNRSTDERVVFNVNEGPLVKIRTMTFSGNKNLADDVLKRQLESPKTCLGAMGIFSDTAVRGDVTKLEEFYKAQGYRDVKVARELTFSKERTQVDVVFRISEGEKLACDLNPHGSSIPEVAPNLIPGAGKGGMGGQNAGLGATNR